MGSKPVLVLLLLGVFSMTGAHGIAFIIDGRLFGGYLLLYTTFLAYFAAHYVENGAYTDITAGQGAAVFAREWQTVTVLLAVLLPAGVAGTAVVLNGFYTDHPTVSGAGIFLLMAAYAGSRRAVGRPLL